MITPSMTIQLVSGQFLKEFVQMKVKPSVCEQAVPLQRSFEGSSRSKDVKSLFQTASERT